ncbi:Kanadaptin [Desmophyllum pertusum]|uniref:Kanadaptin n=1 Tax=Desmophyllum pertusum TaxID=174260 RepID=A0A9X0DAD4_9CNID|nr:Kanadaptin [Desmophyllum pertusum]
MSDQSADNDSQSGRKRIGSDGATDVQIEQNKETEENNEEIPKKKKKRCYGVPSQWQAESDPTYAAWMPPEGQTGDGRTHLNEKFGY